MSRLSYSTDIQSMYDQVVLKTKAMKQELKERTHEVMAEGYT